MVANSIESEIRYTQQYLIPQPWNYQIYNWELNCKRNEINYKTQRDTLKVWDDEIHVSRLNWNEKNYARQRNTPKLPD